MTKIDQARQKFKPQKIKCLLIAESAPDVNSERFFYFEKHFKHGDTLFMETMKALFPVEGVTGSHYKENKSTYLRKFQQAGFYLEDASSIPFPKKSKASFKKRTLQVELSVLLPKLKSIITPKTPIILIAYTVYEVCFAKLKAGGYNVLNKEPIPFPISNQEKFRTGLTECTKRISGLE